MPNEIQNRDTPRKLIVTRCEIPRQAGSMTKEWRCPTCNAQFIGIQQVGDRLYGSTNYCGNCGQRLDWTEDDR